MIERRRFLSGLAAAVVAPSSWARQALADEPKTLDEALAAVAKARSSLRTLVGPFTQARKIGLLASEVKSTGTMMLSRPDRLRWELGSPDDVTYWVVPEGLAYKSKSGQGRASGPQAQKVAQALDDLRVVLGGDLGQLRARYQLKLVPAKDGLLTFEATPQSTGGARFQKVTFALQPDLARPARATLVETARDKTEIVFGELKRDVAIDPALLRAPA